MKELFRELADPAQSESYFGFVAHSRKKGRARPTALCMVVVRMVVMATASASISTSWKAAPACPRPSQVRKIASTMAGYAAMTYAALLNAAARERPLSEEARSALRTLSSKRIGLSQRGWSGALRKNRSRRE